MVAVSFGAVAWFTTLFPRLPPPPDVAQRIFMDFEANYRALERWHLTQRTKVIQAKHQHHNRLLYQQLRSQKAGSVSHLKHVVDFQVALVLDYEHVELDTPVLPLPSPMWTLQGPLAHVEVTDTPQVVKIESDLLLAVGQKLTAACYLTDFEDLERELHSLWHPIWQKHAGLAAQHWDRIIAFGRAFLPPGDCSGPIWTSGHFRSVKRRLREDRTLGIGWISLPCRRASDMWGLLQLSLEVARLSDQPMTGFCADLVKCFNLLARAPLFDLLGFLGLSSSTVQAWSSALEGLLRRFRIFHDIGPAHLSTTGYPEGDPLSCVAMLAFNTIFDAYVQQYAPSCFALAYVDNVQLISDVASNLQQGCLVMETFMEAWDLAIDPKSYAWSTDAAQRSILRIFGHPVLLHSKDLGSQMHYAGRNSRKVLSQRLASVSHYWSLLRASTAHSWFKQQAIRSAVWPKVLHACESPWVCVTTLDSLRSRCVFALRWDRAGANPVVRWALMLPLGFDPSFVQVWMVLSSFWRLTRMFPLVCDVWTSFGFQRSASQGILHSIHAALDLLSWTLDELWTLHLGPFSVPWFDTSLEALRLLAGHFWQQAMCQKIGSRLDFASVKDIDVDLSFRSYVASDFATSELVAAIQDGAFFTSHMKAKWDTSKQATCPVCHVEDNLRHRCTICPRYQSLRDQFPQQAHRWNHEERAFLEHGIVPMNPFLYQHWQYLCELPNKVECFYLTPIQGQHYEIFTDGTCSNPTCRLRRLAAWAVVAMDMNRVVASGPVVGLIQTIDVAELTAALSALTWAQRFNVSVCIHSDSQFVVDGLLFIRSRGFVPRYWRHQALWGELLVVLQQLEKSQWSVHQVYSHGDVTTVVSCLDEWWTAGNDKADFAALCANRDRTPEFWRNFKDLTEYKDRTSERVRSQLQFLVQLAQQDFKSADAASFDTEDLPLHSLKLQWFTNDAPFLSVFEPNFIDELPVSSRNVFPVQFLREVLNMLFAFDIEAENARYVTGIELVVAFVHLYKGTLPFPRSIEGEIFFEYPQRVRGGGLMRLTIAQALDLFWKAIHHLAASAGAQLSYQHSSRPELGLIVPQKSVLVGWPLFVEHSVSGVVAGMFSSRPHRRACDIARPLQVQT
eukprot:Skav203521  [mRNA]  locus=scaffold687:165732:169360:+ [translate_table: standard]